MATTREAIRTYRLCILLLVLGACTPGPDAPTPARAETLCSVEFCVSYPSDWSVDEIAGDFAVFSHPDGEGAVAASVGQINMRGLADATERHWPQPPAVAVQAFWELLEPEDGALDGFRVRSDGSVSSSGTFRDGHLWHRLVPIDADRAVGVEIRAQSLVGAPCNRVHRRVGAPGRC